MVWALPISLAATFGIDVSFFSSAYLDVSVQRVPRVKLCIGLTLTEVCSAGFPHSEICGSQDMCSSPQLIAAYHVFLRLSVPRHPPCALSCFIWLSFIAGTIYDFLTHIALCAQMFFGSRFRLHLYLSISIKTYNNWYLIFYCALYSVFNVHLALSNPTDLTVTKEEILLFFLWSSLLNFFINLAAAYSPIPSPV